MGVIYPRTVALGQQHLGDLKVSGEGQKGASDESNTSVGGGDTVVKLNCEGAWKGSERNWRGCRGYR